MSRKIRKFSLAILLIVILGIGGKVYMDKREAQKQQDLLAVEKQSVKVLKNTFADIKEVKVEEFKKNPVTGSYGALVTMTNNEGKSVYFDYFFYLPSGDCVGGNVWFFLHSIHCQAGHADQCGSAKICAW